MQIVSDGNCTANLGVNNPANYCQSTDDLTIITSCFVVGDQINGAFANMETLIGMPYNVVDGDAHIVEANANEVGTVWGLAYQSISNTIFASAFYRRHTGLGPSGIAAIYQIDKTNGTTSTFMQLDDPAYFGANAFGNSLHPTNNDENSWRLDSNSYNLVGKIGLGDIDISESQEHLYTINLLSRELIEIPIGSPPIAADMANIRTFPIPTNQTDCPSPDDIRPFGLGIHNGKVYIGCVCSGESQGEFPPPPVPVVPYELETYTRAYVYEFDPENTDNGFVEKINFDLDFRWHISDFGNFYDNFWGPWGEPFPSDALSDEPILTRNMQPWLVDIEFDQNDMILGFRDRFGDQQGFNMPQPNDDGNLYNPVAFGDILRACSDNNGNWTLESNGSCGNITVSTYDDAFPPIGGVNDLEGPDGGEYYWSDGQYFDFGDHEPHSGIVATVDAPTNSHNGVVGEEMSKVGESFREHRCFNA